MKFNDIPYDLSGLRVLAVEDSGYMLKIIRVMLEAMGINLVTTLNRPETVISQLDEIQPDIIITDHFMEPINGLELIRRIRYEADGDFRYIPVIMLTGFADYEVVFKARFEAGADAVLVKPVSAHRLFSCIIAVYESTRKFVETEAYFGPDRRVTDRPFEGIDRRRDSGGKAVEPLSAAIERLPENRGAAATKGQVR